MNKKPLILFTAVLVTILTVVAINVYAAGRVEDMKAQTPYTLKQLEDHVAVYKGDKMIEEFDSVNFYALPSYDRNALKSGMTFENIEEIYSIIEDFDG